MHPYLQTPSLCLSTLTQPQQPVWVTAPQHRPNGTAHEALSNCAERQLESTSKYTTSVKPKSGPTTLSYVRNWVQTHSPLYPWSTSRPLPHHTHTPLLGQLPNTPNHSLSPRTPPTTTCPLSGLGHGTSTSLGPLAEPNPGPQPLPPPQTRPSQALGFITAATSPQARPNASPHLTSRSSRWRRQAGTFGLP